MADLAPIQIGDGLPPAPVAPGDQSPAEPAFADLVEAWHEPLYRFAYGLCGEPLEAARLTTLTFRRWLERTDRRARSADGPRGLFATLHRDYIRTADLLPTPAGASAFPPEPRGSTTPLVQPGPAVVAAALQQISLPARVPLALMYAGNFTLAEIAAILDQPLAEVRARVARGKIQLIAALQRPAAARTAAAG